MKAIVNYKGGSLELKNINSVKFMGHCSGVTLVFNNYFSKQSARIKIDDVIKNVSETHLQVINKTDDKTELHIYSGTHYTINVEIVNS